MRTHEWNEKIEALARGLANALMALKEPEAAPKIEAEPTDMRCPDCGGSVEKVSSHGRPTRFICCECNEQTHLSFKVRKKLGKVIDLTGKDKPVPPPVRNPKGKAWMGGENQFVPGHIGPHLYKMNCSDDPPCRGMTPAEAFRPGAVVRAKDERGTSIEGSILETLTIIVRMRTPFSGAILSVPIDKLALVTPAPEGE